MDDQQRVKKFLDEFSRKLAEKFEEELDFILLFGSASRGEWKRGISDVDLIIQVKRADVIKNVKKYADQIFWELDEKYETKFREACSVGDEKDIIKGILKKTKLYVPYEVFGPQDIDWVSGEIKRKDLLLGAKLVASQAMLFKKMKSEGKILWGRDIRKVIQAEASWWEKIKAILIPYHLSMASLFGALLAPKISLKMADKAALYSLESTLFFLDKPIGGGIKKAAKEIEKGMKERIKYKRNIFGAMEIDLALNFDYQKLLNFNFASEAIKLKHNWPEESKDFNRWKTLKFCWRSLFFVNAMNLYAVWKADRHRLILKALFILRTILVFLVIWLYFHYFR
ncbi:nucleotidyltransferase domain-containing protein [Candidatus Parcubacteria bacterium]|nr:nucleotidyltransferase domain-containing protein [Candidatus Parcubacteria bacterium]